MLDAPHLKQIKCTVIQLFNDDHISPHLHPVVLFQRNEIFSKVCYVCFLLSETGILLFAQIFL